MRHLTKGKGNSKRAHKPASNGVFPHVASPLEGRVVSHPIWGMLQWGGQDVPLVRPSSCTVKGGIPSSRRYLPTYLGYVAILPHLCVTFPQRGKMTKSDYEGWQVAYIGT